MPSRPEAAPLTGRREQILDVAQELFFSRGYASTPVARIIEGAGVSKGTFYHYFESKADLLQSIVERVGEQILAAAREATSDPGLDPVEKCNAFFRASSRWKAEHRELIMAMTRALHTEENVLLRHRLARLNLEVVAEILAEVIQEGVEAGVFTAPHPRETAESIFHLMNGAGERIAELLLGLEEDAGNADRLRRSLESLRGGIERLLGTPEGSIQLADEAALAAFLEPGGRET